MVTSQASSSSVGRAPAALVTVRFGEFLRDRHLISDEQWLAALAAHWSESPRRRLGDTLVELGLMASALVEEAADVFHDGLDVVEVQLSTQTLSAALPVGAMAGAPAPLHA